MLDDFEKDTTLGLDENIEGALSYLLTWLSALFFIAAEKKSNYVRFHAFQSLFLFLPLTILWVLFRFVGPLIPIAIIEFILYLLSFLIIFFMLIAVVFLGATAYNGDTFRIPVIGDFAEKFLSKY